MKTTKRSMKSSLSAQDIQKATLKRLKKYEKLNFLEQFAMFMGMAQLLENALKQLLVRLFDYDIEGIDRWTLGTTAVELEKCGLRRDFLPLLQSVVKHRNLIAHELLAQEFMLAMLLKGRTGRLVRRHLEKGIYELEQIMFLYEWTEKHGDWLRHESSDPTQDVAATTPPSNALTSERTNG